MHGSHDQQLGLLHTVGDEHFCIPRFARAHSGWSPDKGAGAGIVDDVVEHAWCFLDVDATGGWAVVAMV